MDDPESSPLLSHKSEENSYGKGSKRYFLSISVILIVFKGTEEMGSVTTKQFIYSWCQRHDVRGNVSVPHTAVDSTTGSAGVCGGGGGDSIQAEDAAQRAASQWELYLNLTNAALLLLSITIYGLISDYLGRKRFLCMAIAGYGIRCAIIASVVYYDLHIAYMLLAYAVDGLLGSVYAVSLCCYVMAADVTTNTKQRALAIVFIELLTGAGKVTTQFANGYFIHSYGYFYPMLTASVGCFAATILTIALLTDTLPARQNIEPLGSIQQQEGSFHKTDATIPSCRQLFHNFVSFYVSSEHGRVRRLFWLCLVTLSLHILTIMGRSDPLVLLQLGRPFCWSAEYIGWYNGLYMAFSYVCAMFMFKLLQQWFSDETIACMGLVSAIMYFLDTGLANTDLWMFAGTAISVLMSLARSVLRAMMSAMAGKNKQGAVFAGIESSELICKLAASPASLALYASTVSTMRGLLFLVEAGVNVVALITMLVLRYFMQKHRAGIKEKTVLSQSDD